MAEYASIHNNTGFVIFILNNCENAINAKALCIIPAISGVLKITATCPATVFNLCLLFTPILFKMAYFARSSSASVKILK